MFLNDHSLGHYYWHSFNQQGSEYTKLANESVVIVSFDLLNTSCGEAWNILPSMIFNLFYGNHFRIEGHQKVISWKIELGALHGCTYLNMSTSNWQHSTIQHRKYKESSSLSNISQSFFQCILTSNIHINCLVLCFTEAIVCCTGIFSCISPLHVFLSQQVSFLHHTSISLISGLPFGPSDVWFWSTRSFAG